MPELRAREQVEDRLGHDVGGRVAHRVELARGRRRRAARRPSRAPAPRAAPSASSLGRRRAAPRLRCLVRPSCLAPPRIKNLSSRQDERSISTSRGSTRLHGAAQSGCASCARAALTGGSRAGSPAAHGWCVRRLRPPGSQRVPGSLWPSATGVSRSTRSDLSGGHRAQAGKHPREQVSRRSDGAVNATGEGIGMRRLARRARGYCSTQRIARIHQAIRSSRMRVIGRPQGARKDVPHVGTRRRHRKVTAEASMRGICNEHPGGSSDMLRTRVRSRGWWATLDSNQ